MPKTLNKERALLFYCATFFIASFSGVCRAETVKISVAYREAAGVLPLVKPMLSPGGKAVVDELTNSLIITDNQEAIQKIRAFLPEVDVLGRLVRVSVKFKEVGSSEDRSLSAGGSVKGDGWEVKKGRKGTIRFTSAHTRLSVPLGQWVSIGGTSEKENEIIKALLESGRGNSNSSLAIFLKVEAN